MADFLLIHGSCHGAWCWRDVIPALEALGHNVRAIDLPSHGADKTPIKDVTLDLYRDTILDAIERPVHLVGHSMAGFPIAAAAEAVPSKIARLIYLCAYAPFSGESVISMRKLQERQPLLDAIEISEDRLSWSPKPEHAKAAFYHDCSDEIVAFAAENIVPEANLPQLTRLEIGARYESVSKSYIRCTDDRTIPPEFQAEMAARLDPADRHEMQSSHSPFFADPNGLAALLDKIARSR